MSTCTVDECQREACQSENKCILHCDKGEYSNERPTKLRLFYDALIDEIVTQIFEIDGQDGNLTQNGITVNKESLINELKNSYRNREASRLTKDITIVLADISFPAWDSRDHFNYTNLFGNFKGIHFDRCSFNGVSIGNFESVKNTEFFFQDCHFHKEWHIVNLPLLGNVNDVVYQQCIFHEGAYAHYSEDITDPNNKIENQLFNNCSFQGELSFDRMVFNSPIFNNTDEVPTTIQEMTFMGCVANEEAKLILNNCCIDKFVSKDTIFKSKFEFKENVVTKFKVINTNFTKIVDTYKTKYREFVVFKSIFEDFAGFENCEFGEQHNESKELMPLFQYATFMSFVTFRNAQFHGGLDISHANLKELPNFLNATISSGNTTRETFRIIKSSFDDAGNKIEANKYFVFEMQKYREELKATKKCYQERIILFLNEWISGFGQNYLRPVCLMVAFSVVYYGLDYGYEHNTLYSIYPPANNIIQCISNIANGASKAVLPISRFLKVGMEFVSIIFYIIYASLIWQAIVAVKRHTRR